MFTLPYIDLHWLQLKNVFAFFCKVINAWQTTTPTHVQLLPTQFYNDHDYKTVENLQRIQLIPSPFNKVSIVSVPIQYIGSVHPQILHWYFFLFVLQSRSISFVSYLHLDYITVPLPSVNKAYGNHLTKSAWWVQWMANRTQHCNGLLWPHLATSATKNSLMLLLQMQ